MSVAGPHPRGTSLCGRERDDHPSPRLAQPRLHSGADGGWDKRACSDWTGELQRTSTWMGSLICCDGELHRRSRGPTSVFRPEFAQGWGSRVFQVWMASGVGCMDTHHGSIHWKDCKTWKSSKILCKITIYINLSSVGRILESFKCEIYWLWSSKRVHAGYMRWSAELCDVSLH